MGSKGIIHASPNQVRQELIIALILTDSAYYLFAPERLQKRGHLSGCAQQTAESDDECR